MAYGGGTWLVQNKVLPGTYINFISKERAELVFSDRGYAALGVELDWGTDGEIFKVENGDFIENSMKYFGHSYDSDKLKGLRDFYKYAQTGYIYKLNTGGAKASNTFGTAKYTGERGNDIKISVQANVDNASHFDVITFVDGEKVDVQTVAAAKDLKNNDFVVFKSDATLTATAGSPMTGGTNGTVTGSSHQSFLDKIDKYFINALICNSNEKTIKDLYVQYTKRMRDRVGAKFVCVVYRASDPDYEGVINVKTKTLDSDFPENSAVYWVGGAEAYCAVNRSLTNTKYNGDFKLEVNETQTELELAVKAGYFIFHKTGDEIRVLKDINSFVSFVKRKNRDFSFAQVIRVLDQIAIDVATIFNGTYLGSSNNTSYDRNDLKKDIGKHHETLEDLRAIRDFNEETDITVVEGETRESVLVTTNVRPVVAMEKLYMNVIVS
jgi:phage tail sheath protein|nr:MAG TPA: tail sheath protein [Caudoviricetes sp.]